jgi:hypothetical protein
MNTYWLRHFVIGATVLAGATSFGQAQATPEPATPFKFVMPTVGLDPSNIRLQQPIAMDQSVSVDDIIKLAAYYGLSAIAPEGLPAVRISVNRRPVIDVLEAYAAAVECTWLMRNDVAILTKRNLAGFLPTGWPAASGAGGFGDGGFPSTGVSGGFGGGGGSMAIGGNEPGGFGGGAMPPVGGWQGGTGEKIAITDAIRAVEATRESPWHGGAAKLAGSLTPAQKQLLRRRGYLRRSDLSKWQNSLLPSKSGPVTIRVRGMRPISIR